MGGTCAGLGSAPEIRSGSVPAAWPTIGTRAYEALCALLAGPVNQAEYRHGWRLAAYIDELNRLRTLLQAGDGDALEAVFERARRARNAWAEGLPVQTAE